MKILQKPKNLGILFALIWCILNAGKDVLIGNFVQDFSPILLSFLVSGIVMITCAIFHIGSFNSIYNKVKENRKHVIFICFANLLIWVCAVHALKYLEPAISAAMTLGIIPIIVYFLQPYLRPKVVRRPTELVAAIGILLAIIYMVANSLLGTSAIGGQSIDKTIIGLACTFVAGISIAFVSFFTKNLYENGWTPINVIFVRLFLVFFSLGAYSFIYLDVSSQISVVTQSGYFWLISLGSLIPTYFSQKALTLLEPSLYSNLICLLPVFVIVIQMMDSRLVFSYHSLFAILLTVFFIVYHSKE